MPENINSLAAAAASDERAREKLIMAQEQTILRMASAAVHHYVSKSDDEWSVALCAFSKAVDTYTEERGDFLPYAGVLIRHDLTDCYRARSREPEPAISLDSPITDEDGHETFIDVPDPRSDIAHNTLKDEILAANEMLAEYGFRFFDLTECSPQQDRSREECAAAIRAAVGSPVILNELRSKKKLPVRALARQSGISKKTLDRYRKYIIMAILILSDDYPQIAEYLKFVGKGEDR